MAQYKIEYEQQKEERKKAHEEALMKRMKESPLINHVQDLKQNVDNLDPEGIEK